jgi:predicted metal-binding membrane protein
VERTTDNTLRSAGRVRSRPTVAGFLSRDHAVIAFCVVLITALAWAYLINLDQQASSASGTMQAMGTMRAQWTTRDFAFTFLMWSVMMAGMMLPSASPVFFLFKNLKTSRKDTDGTSAVALFGLGYLVAWLGFSALAAIAQWFLNHGLLLSPTMAVMNTWAAGLILVAAGAYQLSPMKRACLRQCQSPLGFIMANWREGRIGALRMGIRHGLFCVGCCWALMSVLFVVGIMNLLWVAALTAFVLIEKVGGAGARVARAGGAIMIGSGILVIASKAVQAFQ